MDEKIIEIQITKKNVHMNNDLKNNTSVTSSESNIDPLKSEYRRIKDTTTRYTHTTYYENYTVILIEGVDINDKTIYSLKILKEDFLPMVGDTIKVCINEENEIIAYIPYINSHPISVIKQHKFAPFDYYKWSTIIHAFPLTAPFYALSSLMPVKRFVDGKSKNTYFFAIFALLIIALQIYSSYNLYQYGGDAVFNSIIGYLASGLVYCSSMILFDMREYANKSLYIAKIKKMLNT